VPDGPRSSSAVTNKCVKVAQLWQRLHSLAIQQVAMVASKCFKQKQRRMVMSVQRACDFEVRSFGTLGAAVILKYDRLELHRQVAQI